MPRRNRDVENTLLNKFRFESSAFHSDDHRWIELRLPNLPAIRPYFSHGRQEIGDTLWRKIAQQLRVRPQYLNGMIDCTNSREDYYKTVATDPYPPLPSSTPRTQAEAQGETRHSTQRGKIARKK